MKGEATQTQVPQYKRMRNFDFYEGVENCAGEMNVAFPIYEYKNRLSKIRKLMERDGLDTLYLTAPESMYYVSGYNCVWHRVNPPKRWAPSAAAGVAINVDCDNFILYDLPDEEGVIKNTSIAEDVRLFYTVPSEIFGKTYTTTTKEEDYKDLVLKDLKQQGWLKEGRKIGLELGSYRPTCAIFLEIKEKLESLGCIVSDATYLVREVRKIKSALELQYIETATRICDEGMAAVYNALHPGITELELVGEYTKAQTAVGGEVAGIANMVRSGPYRCKCFHIPAGRRKIMIGDPVGVDLAGVYNRYHSNQCRYFSIEEPSKEYMKEYEVNETIISAVKELIKPNLPVKDFLKDLKKYYEESGLWEKKYWIGGYEMGIAFPPDWVGEFDYDICKDLEDDEKIFLPGMVVNMETGFGVIDTIMFKEEEAVMLGKTTRKLMIKERE